jgi:hypothetical protein
VGVIARVRALAVGIAKSYVAQQQGETASEEEEPVNKRPKAKNETVMCSAPVRQADDVIDLSRMKIF